MIKGIHHIAISASDLERSMHFYCDLLGFEKIWDIDWDSVPQMDAIMDLKNAAGRLVMLQAGNTYVELYQYRHPAPTPVDPNRPVCDHGLTHICVNVSDVDAEYERLSAAGMKFHSPPMLFDDGKIKCTYGRDPDGNVIEILETPDPNHTLALARTATSSKSQRSFTQHWS